jgi:FdhE protein
METLHDRETKRQITPQFRQTINLWSSPVNAAVTRREKNCLPAPVACRKPMPHNRPMANTAWQQRIRRAEKLSEQYPFAAEILGFYQHVAKFQEDVYREIDGGMAGVSPAVLQDSSAANPFERQLLARFPQFLNVVQKHGPERVAQAARELRSAADDVWSDLLNSVWFQANESPASPEEFLAFALLQPYAEFVRLHFRLQLEGYTQALCPLCNRKPAMGVLRQQGDGGRRSLVCGFCMTEWEFRRVVCPGCGQENHAKLPVYTAETIPHIRVECCDDCKTYIKSIDLTKNGLADPLVDELAAVPLNLWAQEHGYAKLQPNLLGM